MASRVFDPHAAGVRAVIGNMLYGNRNFPGMGGAEALACCSNGRMYVATSVILRLCMGYGELTADRLANLATLLDFPAGDLAAVIGMALPEGSPPEDPPAADVAALLWEVRRLSAGQMRQVAEQAHAMRSQLTDDAVRTSYASRPHGVPAR